MSNYDITCTEEAPGQFLARVSRQKNRQEPGEPYIGYDRLMVATGATEKEAVIAAVERWIGGWK